MNLKDFKKSLSDSKKLSLKQVWLWPNKAPGIAGSRLYDITIQYGSKDMSLET